MGRTSTLPIERAAARARLRAAGAAVPIDAAAAVRRRPWGMLGAALLAGYCVGRGDRKDALATLWHLTAWLDAGRPADSER